MPDKGSIRKRPPTTALVNRELIKAYEKQTGRKDSPRFRQIAKALYAQMAEWIVDDEEGFKLPYNIGILLVKRYTPRRKAVDSRKTAKMGQIVYYQNRHSFGDSITTTWIKPEYIKYRNLKAYTFKADRRIKRASSKRCLAGKAYKRIESRDRYAREMTALDNIQEQYEDKLNKPSYR